MTAPFLPWGGGIYKSYDGSQIFEYIEKLAFFNDFTSEEKAEVASFTPNVISRREGNLIIQQGSNDPSLRILFDGEVV